MPSCGNSCHITKLVAGGQSLHRQANFDQGMVRRETSERYCLLQPQTYRHSMMQRNSECFRFAAGQDHHWLWLPQQGRSELLKRVEEWKRKASKSTGQTGVSLGGIGDKGEGDKSARKVWNSFADAEADSHDAHGAPLGADEAEAWFSSKTREECTAFLSLQFADLCFSPSHQATRKQLGWNYGEFEVWMQEKWMHASI